MERRSAHIDEIRPSTEKLSSLTDDQRRRLRVLYEFFKHVDASPWEHWVRDMEADRVPEKELRIIEANAAVYQHIREKYAITDIQAEKQLYLFVTSASLGMDITTLGPTQHFSRRQVQYIYDQFLESQGSMGIGTRGS